MAAFPEQLIDLICEISPGADLTADPSTWTFTPLGNDTILGVPRLMNTPITHQHGTAVGASSSQTMSATIQCLNLDGYLTPELPTSPWWPYVDAGTPIRLRMRTRSDLVDTFTRTAVINSWGIATSGETWTPASGATAFSTTGTTGLINFVAANATRNIRSTRTDPDVDIVYDTAVPAVATGAALVVGPQVRSTGTGLYRLWLRTEFSLAGAIVLRAAAYYNNATVSTSVAAATVAALTYAANTVIRTRVQVIGNAIRMRAWLASGAEPSTWHLDYTQTSNNVTGYNTAATAADLISIRADVVSTNTNTLPLAFTFDNVTIAQPYRNRVEGYIADVKPTFEPQSGGTTWSTVTVDIGGIGTRLEKNQSPSFSPMRRSVQTSFPPPIAYWHGEDDEGSTSAASAFPGLSPLLVTGPAVFAFAKGVPADQYQSRFGTKPMVSVAAGAKLSGAVPATAVQTEWAVSLVAEFYVPGVLPAITELRVAEWRTGGTFARWALIGTTTGYKVRAYNDVAGTSTDVATSGTAFQGQQTYTVESAQNGANIDVQLRLNDNLAASGSIAGTLANATWIDINPDLANVTASVTPAGLTFIVGHVRVVDDTAVRDLPFYSDPDTGNIVFAGDAWYQESVHRRLSRLSDEERVPFRWIGNPQGKQITVLNTQQDGSYSDLMKQGVESESGGLLYEDAYGYTHLPRAMRYNQPVALTIDMATYRRSDDTDQGAVLVPQLDSRATNYWTVTRALGSSGTAAAPAAYRQRRGTIAEEVTVDVLYDADLHDHASWRTHLSVDAAGANYPSVLLDLAANPGLVDSWLSCTIGSRVQRTNQPVIAGIGTIDQVIVGISETFSPTSWQATLTCTPGDVWDVAVYDGTTRRQDSASTVTNASYAPGVTSVVFKTTAVGDLWSTTSTPYDCICLGERFTVTAMGAASGTGPYLQTATVTRAVNGVAKTLTAAAEIHMHPDQLARYAL